VKQRRTYGDNFGSNERKCSLSHHSPPTQEATLSSGDAMVLNERTRFFPEAETKTVVIGPTSKVEDDAEDDEAWKKKKKGEKAATSSTLACN
jgi:D-lyxose ketol-isomerase